MGVSDKIKRELGKKLSGNQALDKEVLRWKRSLAEVDRQLGGSKKGSGKKEQKSDP